MRSLIITGQQHDADMNMDMGDNMQHRHSIVISATNVVPEFPVGIAFVVAALAIVGVILAAKRQSFFPAGKTY